jgi:HEAT repeat protein
LTISWEAGLLLALLATASLLLLSLLACSRWHGRQAVRAAGLERDVARMLAAWTERAPSPGELERLSRLGRADRRVLLRGFVRALPDSDAPVAARAREALRRSGLLAGELARLRHRSAGERAEACRLLGRLGVADAAPLLVERLRDADRTVRHDAVGALGDLRAVDALGQVVQAIEDAGDWGNLLAVMTLVRMGRGSVPEIGALLRWSTSPTMTKALLQVTGQLGAAADPQLVRALTSHDEPEVRIEALRALGTLGSDSASVAACLEALDDPEWPARALAAWSLGRLGDARAIARLRQAMGDPAYWVRHHVAEALAALGEAGESALRGAADDPNPFVRDMAAQALYLRAARAGAA